MATTLEIVPQTKALGPPDGRDTSCKVSSSKPGSATLYGLCTERIDPSMAELKARSRNACKVSAQSLLASSRVFGYQ